MSRLKNIFMALIFFCVLILFAGCSNDSTTTETTPPPTPPDSSTQIIDESEAVNFFNQTVELILNGIENINSLSNDTKPIYQNNQMFGVTGKIEEILDSALVIRELNKVYKNQSLKSGKLYSYSKSKDEMEFARFSIAADGSSINFSIITKNENTNKKIIMYCFETKIEQSEIISVNFKCAQTDENGKNLSLFGFELKKENKIMTLYFGQPSTSMDAVLYLYDFNCDVVVWDSYMICNFDFNNNATQKIAIKADIRAGNNKLKPPELYKNVVHNANFNELSFTYVEFNLLKDDNKNIESQTLFENINAKNLEYDSSENLFKFV